DETSKGQHLTAQEFKPKSLPPLGKSLELGSDYSPSRSESTSDILHLSFNKKKSPDKLVSIDQAQLSFSNFRDFDTPITIDIISEAGRLSRQSLDPLTSRELYSAKSSRPTSVKDSGQKSCGKMQTEKTLVEKFPKTNENKSDKERLDTIKESLSETLRINVKKLDLNPQKHTDKTKPITSILKKPQHLVSKSLAKNTENNECTKKTSFGSMKSVPIKTKAKNPPKTEPTKTQTPRTKLSPIESPNDIFNASFQSTLTTISSASKSTICPSNDIFLEVNSSRINLAEKPLSAKSEVSLVEPKEPVIFTMFENYPQPYSVASVQAEKNSKPKSGTTKKKTSAKKVKSATTKPTGQKINPKKTRNKILISQEIDVNLQKEIDQSMYNDMYDSEFDENVSVSSKNSVNYLSDNEKEISEIKLDSNETSSNTKAARIAVKSAPDKMVSEEYDQGRLNSKINKDFVQSIEDKLFAIYTKYDNLLMQQENEEKAELLNNQKAEFSEEMANQLKDNINFEQEDLDSNAKRLKELYQMAKQNSEKKVISKPPIPSDSKKENTLNTLNRTPSIRSDTKGNKNSLRSSNTAEQTIVPGIRKNFKLPPGLSDKINTLMIPLPNEVQSGNFNQRDDEEKLNLSSKLKLNSRKFDSIGNESANSSASFDSNSITYHYDLKYRNDRNRSPISLQIESENDFQFRWKRGNLLGKGAFGSVFQAMLSTGEIIAVKQIEMEESDPVKARAEYECVREEVKILRELEHENIVQFMGTMLECNVVNIFMELIPGGTIEALLKTFGPFDEELFKNFTNQIAEGINYLHSCNVVHRDIKGKNIMLMSNGIVKLIDFGCAKRLRKNQSSNSIKQLLKSLKGTPYWMSPEVIRETGHGSKADIWSFGATVFEMAVGRPPWGDLSPLSAIYAIGSGESPPPELPEHFTEEARDFVRKCLTRDPDLRPYASELLNHEFLK
ncbi:ankyrin-2-like isoform X1, partial [Brachionus plicatilis]